MGLAGQRNLPVSTPGKDPIPIVKGVFKKDRTFPINILLLIFSTVPFKSPSTGDTPFQRLFHCLNASWNELSVMAQFFCRIFLNLLCGLETTSFRIGFKFVKQEKFYTMVQSPS